MPPPGPTASSTSGSPTQTPPPPGLTTEVHIGFTDSQSHGYWHFVDNGFASDSTTVPPTPAPNAATQITALRNFIASSEDDTLKAYDLLWLEHLVGDIHQPLHGSDRFFAGAHDAGGNDVKIQLTAAMKKYFDGTLSKSAPPNSMPTGTIFPAKVLPPPPPSRLRLTQSQFPTQRLPASPGPTPKAGAWNR